MSKRIVSGGVCALVVGLLAPTFAFAATEVEKRAAIDGGIDYLLSTQNTNGSWYGQNGFYDIGTGLAILALAEEELDRQAAGLPDSARYVAIRAAVKDGMDYLLRTVTPYAISNQAAGNPDTYVNGQGLRWAPGVSEYVSGFALPGLVKAAQALGIGKNDTVAVAGSPVNGWKMGDVVQDVVDYLAYGQNEPGAGVYRGGWRYGPNFGSSDNSVSQFPTLALVYAADYGVTVPNFVKTELTSWANYIQRSDGGSGYASPTDSQPEWLGRTGGLLLQNLLIESASGSPDRSTQLSAALGFMNTYWHLNNLGSFYSIWGAYKGLEAELGIYNKGPISNLYYNEVWGGGNFDNPNNNVWNWWEDYCEWLVNTQQTGAFAGSRWSSSGHLNEYNTDTAIAVSILKGIRIPETYIPEPITMFGAMVGLGMLGGYLRRRRRAL